MAVLSLVHSFAGAFEQLHSGSALVILAVVSLLFIYRWFGNKEEEEEEEENKAKLGVSCETMMIDWPADSYYNLIFSYCRSFPLKSHLPYPFLAVQWSSERIQLSSC